jgi:lipopolysaccharide cholinephosphotransferase
MKPEVLKRKQETLLDILREVVKVCEKHGVRYYAISGTLIGTVRHKGFVPWDDDIDIAMPREDLKRFLKIAPGELPAHLSVIDPLKVRHMRVPLCKVENTQTTCIEGYQKMYPERYIGVNIDIMPLDGFPPPGLKRKIKLAYLQLLRILNIHKRLRFTREEMKPKPKARRVFNVLFKPFRPLFPFAFYNRRFNASLSRTPFDKSDYVYFSWLPNEHMRVFNKKPFEDIVKLDFEDIQINAPAGYHEYLTGDYGDYMTPPPEKYRRPPHSEGGILDFDRPYSYYQQNPGE